MSITISSFFAETAMGIDVNSQTGKIQLDYVKALDR
jgi:hypothetical protein